MTRSRIGRTGLAGLALLLLSASAWRQGATPSPPGVNDVAPDFELMDSNGKAYRLSELRGRNVILEFIRSGSW